MYEAKGDSNTTIVSINPNQLKLKALVDVFKYNYCFY